MENLRSSNRRAFLRLTSEALFCPIRKQHVAAQPEEMVRQHLIQYMITKLGYPKQNLVVEKQLSQFPTVNRHLRPPECRIDLACIKQDGSFSPLLLIECKAVPINQKTLQQIIGYNYYLNASYIAIANQKEIQTGRYNPKANNYTFFPFLPHYQDLAQHTSNTN